MDVFVVGQPLRLQNVLAAVVLREHDRQKLMIAECRSLSRLTPEWLFGACPVPAREDFGGGGDVSDRGACFEEGVSRRTVQQQSIPIEKGSRRLFGSDKVSQAMSTQSHQSWSTEIKSQSR